MQDSDAVNHERGRTNVESLLKHGRWSKKLNFNVPEDGVPGASINIEEIRCLEQAASCSRCTSGHDNVDIIGGTSAAQEAASSTAHDGVGSMLQHFLMRILQRFEIGRGSISAYRKRERFLRF